MATETLVHANIKTAAPAKRFTLYSKSEYYNDIVARITRTKKGDRIAMATMAFEPDEPGVSDILSALGKAAERGVSTSLAVDAYIFLSHDKRGPGPLFFANKLPRRMPKIFRRKLEIIKTLRTQGVACAITNQPGRPFTSPVAGRSHIKYTIINHRLYVGGCNLNDVTDIDMMVGWDDRKTSDWLYDFASKMIHTQGTTFMQGKDLEFSVDSLSELLVDSGIRKQSIILTKALELIDQAQKEIFLTCQFFPNSVTAKHLVAAHHRGVVVSVVYNPANKHPIPYSVLHHLVDARERLRTPAPLFANRLSKQHPYLHAKVLATEKGAIIGSHNFVAAGVNFGTAEIALLRYDPDFSRELQGSTRQLIALSPS